MSTTDSTDLTGYDVVMAVTQDALNAALGYSPVWSAPINYNLSATPIPPNQPLDPLPSQDQCDGLYNTYLAPPTLSLTLPSGAVNTNQVAVTLSFNSGTLQYFDSSQRSEVAEDISGWKISFVVDIALGTVPGDADTSGYPTAVQEALSNPSLSVQQLFLNLMELDWTDADFTDSTGSPVTNLEITGTLQQSLEGYFISLDSAVSQAVLSWLQAAPGSGQSPSYVPPEAIEAFVPTAYRFSVTPYSPSGDNDGLGTVNFLMMTQNRAVPTSSAAGIFDTNWVPAPNTSQSQGTFCMSKGLFDSGYVVGSLLPAIATVISAPNPSITNTGTDTWSISSSTTLYADQNDGKGEEVEDDLVENVYQTIYKGVSCTVQLASQADPPIFNVSGTYTAKQTITGESLGFIDIVYTTTCTQDWSFQVALKAGSDGTIVASAVNGDNSQVVQVGQYDSTTDGDNLLGDLDAALSNFISNFATTFATDFQTQSMAVMSDDFDDIEQGISGALSSLSSMIVFPGGRNYAYSSLSFSTGGEENMLSSVTIKE